MYPGERFNSYSHLAGLMLCLAWGAALLGSFPPHADAAKAAGVAVFASGTVLVYAVSTLFHSTRGRAKRFWRRADHCSVFLLIAASYTPFALAGPRDAWDWGMLAMVWIGAVLAIAHSWRTAGRSAPALGVYLGMGWLTVVAAVPLAARMHGGELIWLVLGAALYTAGTLFYQNPLGWRHAHGVWHLCVIGGTVSHFVAVWQVVMGR